MTVHQAERALIEATLAHHGGSKRETAKTLGVSLKTLYNKLNAYGTGAVKSRRAPPQLCGCPIGIELSSGHSCGGEG